MSPRSTVLVLLSSLLFGIAPARLSACTSFAAYGGDRPWYGMNFDYPAVEITLSIRHSGQSGIFFGGFGTGGRIASMNDRGLYAGFQLLFYNRPQSFSNPSNSISIGDLCEYSIANLGSVSEVTTTIGSRRIVRSWNQDSHALIADPTGSAIVVEPFGAHNGITPVRDGFIVMTNLPNYDFLDQPYTAVHGVGGDRYLVAYEHVHDHLTSFGYADAMETLRLAQQNTGPYPTQVSLVFDPTRQDVYVCFAREFSKVWRVSLADEIVETFSGFAVHQVQTLSSIGVTASALKKAPEALLRPPTMLRLPVSTSAAVGSGMRISGAAIGTGIEYQWMRNGDRLADRTYRELDFPSTQPTDAGLYVFSAANSAGMVAAPAIVVGPTATTKVSGAAREILPTDIHHANGNVYDQVLLSGSAAAITTDVGQITRLSYIDLDDDIVQVEFSGPGTVSIVLDGTTDPAMPVNYNQNVAYVKGHASIVITGATRDSHLGVFTVGRTTAVNEGLFKPDIVYDGIADLAYIAIASSDGKFGGLRTANVNYFSHKGLTGLYAPGVEFTGPVFLGNVTAFETATPVIIVGSAADETWVTGGDLSQPNGAAVQVCGLSRLEFHPGTDSHGHRLPAKTNQAVLQQAGADVTSHIVVNPSGG